MQKIKPQSSQGSLLVDFTVASVAFNLYKSPKVKFYDPINEGVEYDAALNQKLAQSYYRSIFSMIKIHQLKKEDKKLLPAIPSTFDAYLITPFALNPIFRPCSLYLLVHKSIANNSWSMESNFLSEYNNNDEISFVDTDGIGICLRMNA